MFFRKKNQVEEIEKPVKKVYDFENDKGKKVNVSALYEALNGGHTEPKQSQSSENSTSSSPIVAEFELNLDDENLQDAVITESDNAEEVDYIEDNQDEE